MVKFIIIFLFIVLIIAVVKLQGNSYARFKVSAQAVRGKIIAMEERRVDVKTQRKRRYVRYAFELEGKLFTGEENVEYDDLWTLVKAGDSITIYYDPKNPSKNYPAALLDRRLGIADKIDVDSLKQ